MSEAYIHRRQHLLEHVRELRRRLYIIALTLLLAAGISYTYADEVYAFLVRPLADSFVNPEQRRLIYTSLAEAFITYIKLALFSGFLISFPVIAWQLYRFLAPGLYKRERWVIIPYLVAAPLLFFSGAALAYYYIFPLAWQFFISFETSGSSSSLPIQLEARVGDYLSLVMQVILAFGLAFQLPVVLTLLARAGLVEATTLAKGRKYALVIIVTVAAFVTPPDILSQIALSIPLYLLYELSIFACRFLEKRRGQSQPIEK